MRERDAAFLLEKLKTLTTGFRFHWYRNKYHSYKAPTAGWSTGV